MPAKKVVDVGERLEVSPSAAGSVQILGSANMPLMAAARLIYVWPVAAALESWNAPRFTGVQPSERMGAVQVSPPFSGNGSRRQHLFEIMSWSGLFSLGFVVIVASFYVWVLSPLVHLGEKKTEKEKGERQRKECSTV